MSVNKNLAPFERAEILRGFGYNINKNSGEITGIKNVAYEDKNPSLCINLDNGLVKDFGNERMDGDIISLLMAQMNMELPNIVERIELIIGRSIEKGVVNSMFIEKKQKEIEFYTPEIKEHLVKCKSMLDEETLENISSIRWYDGVFNLSTLKKYNCGYYNHNDYDFSRSDKSYLRKPLLMIPYPSGIMLYNRDNNNKKFVRHIKGSYASGSFFGIRKDMEKSNILIISKSPRECMSISEYLDFRYNVIGIPSNETIKNLSDFQIKQIESLRMPGVLLKIKLIIDFDKKSYEQSYKTVTALKNASIGKNWTIELCSISHSSKGEYKDFTDLFQEHIEDAFESLVLRASNKLSEKGRKVFAEAITNPIKVV